MGVESFGPFREHMEPLWEQARVLLGGTCELRKSGTVYLPQFENETAKNYNRRLSLASLTNFYVKARNNMVGEMFREDIQYKDGTLPDELLDNIDRRGTDLQGMAEKIAETMLSKGVGGIVVDHPQNDGNITLADEKRLDIRHYWTFVKPESVIDLVCTYHAGKETIIQVRWFEDHVVPGNSDFEFKTERRIIVLDRPIETDGETAVIGRPRGRVYRGGEKARKKHYQDSSGRISISSAYGAFEPVGEWRDLVGFDEIPFVPFYANREGVFKANPPLADIAEKNIQHWRQSSNYGNALEIGAFPIMVRFGLKKITPTSPLEEDLPRSDDGESIIGPHIIMDLPPLTEGTGAQYLEPSGQAYTALERSLDRIIHEAELMAIDLLTRQDGGKTATESNFDRLQELAPLQRVALEIERAMNRCLEITAKARGRNEKPGFVEINKDFGVSASDALRIQAIKDAYVAGVLTDETYLGELQRIGALSAYLDVKKEAAEAAAKHSEPTFGNGDPDPNDLQALNVGAGNNPPPPQRV